MTNDERNKVLEEAAKAVDSLASSGENNDDWTVTRDLAFHRAQEAVRALMTQPVEHSGDYNYLLMKESRDYIDMFSDRLAIDYQMTGWEDLIVKHQTAKELLSRVDAAIAAKDGA